MKTIALDCGHGLNTPGKQTPDGVKEWSINDKVGKLIAQKLDAYQDVKVVRIDDTTGKTDITLENRMAKVKSLNPDIFVSIHHNANTSKWGDWTGVETYSHPKAPALDASLAKKMVDKMASKTGLRNRGAKTEDFYVLRNCPSSVPAVLCEGGFMDSRVDNPVITSSKGQEAYAQAIVEVLVEYLKLVKKPVAPAPTPTTGKTWYRVVCGSHSTRAAADQVKAKLEKEGYSGVWIDVYTEK